MKKKSHPEFVRALKARNLKITVVGTYENCLSRVAVRCDVCGWEWAPVGGSLLRGHGCPKCAGTMRKSHAEFVEELTYIIHSGFISGYQNRYGDNLKPPTNVYHRMTA